MKKWKINDENDAGSFFPGVFKKSSHSGRADSDKHFVEGGTGCRYKCNVRFTGQGFGWIAIYKISILYNNNKLEFSQSTAKI